MVEVRCFGVDDPDILTPLSEVNSAGALCLGVEIAVLQESAVACKHCTVRLPILPLEFFPQQEGHDLVNCLLCSLGGRICTTRGLLEASLCFDFALIFNKVCFHFLL